MAKKHKLPLDTRGGTVVISRAMLESDAYLTLPVSAKLLMLILQGQWRNDRFVAYGVREAAKKIGCKPDTVSKAFNFLLERGFIVCVGQSLFNSKTGSKTREWRLTWMPFEWAKPTHDWEKWQPKK